MLPLLTPLLTTGALAASFEVQVAGLATGATVPTPQTCDGANRSPDLRWAPAPSPVRTYAIIVDDPDAPMGTWTHWLAWDIPVTTLGLSEGVKPTDPGLVQGLNDFRQVGWGGACPPRGNGVHHYHVRMYALSVVLDLPVGSTRQTLDAAMAGHIVATGEWVGTYERKGR